MQLVAKKLFGVTKETPGIKQLFARSNTQAVATATADVAAPMTDRVCDLKIRVCSFIAEHDLSFTIAQPLVDLCKKVAVDKNALTNCPFPISMPVI